MYRVARNPAAGARGPAGAVSIVVGVGGLLGLCFSVLPALGSPKHQLGYHPPNQGAYFDHSFTKSRRPDPILCEDLPTVRGKVLAQYGPERVGLKGANGQ